MVMGPVLCSPAFAGRLGTSRYTDFGVLRGYSRLDRDRMLYTRGVPSTLGKAPARREVNGAGAREGRPGVNLDQSL